MQFDLFFSCYLSRMPKYYCDYCDIYLAHSSIGGRRQHTIGRKHIQNKIDYYQKVVRDRPGMMPMPGMMPGPMGMAPPMPGMPGMDPAQALAAFQAMRQGLAPPMPPPWMQLPPPPPRH